VPALQKKVQGQMKNGDATEIDYRNLLRRYMAHVLYWEGCTFVWQAKGDLFTPAELEVLEQLSSGVLAERAKKAYEI
jgi:hypothetical protein